MQITFFHGFKYLVIVINACPGPEKFGPGGLKKADKPEAVQPYTTVGDNPG